MPTARNAARRRMSLFAVPALLLSPLLVYPAVALDPAQYADPAFQRTWERTDKPVEDGAVARTWVWGMPVTGAVEEPYVESPNGARLVQYFDKTRMEITDPNGDQGSIWYVTNGLLVVELMTGLRQAGNGAFAVAGRAEVNVAGDPSDPDAVTYADLASLTDSPPLADGATIIQRMDGNGDVLDDPSLVAFGITAAHRLTVPGIDHQIASVFWDYMNSTGLIWENGEYATASLFPDPYYATGFPVTEAYWTNVDVGGHDTLVLLQCFERRCLTYTPTNAPEWRVEMGNVGLHYHSWRYAPVAEPGAGLFIGFVDQADASGSPAARREPNATPVPRGSVSIAHSPGGSGDYAIVFDMENAGEITSYQVRFRPPYPGSQHVMLDETVPSGASTLGSLTDVIELGDLSDGIETGTISAGQFNQMMERGDITIFVKTTQFPNGFEGRLKKPNELVFNANLIPNVTGPIVGNVSTYISLTDNTIEYSTMAFVPEVEDAYIEWEDEEGGERIIPLIPAEFARPTWGDIAMQEVQPSSVAWFAHQLFTGKASFVLTTATNPNIVVTGTPVVIHPEYQPALWFFVQNGTNVVPPVDTQGRGTGVLTWNSLNHMDVLVTSADVAGVTGVNVYLGPRGENGPVLFSLPVDQVPGETNGVLGAWQVGELAVGLTLTQFAFYLNAQRAYMTQTTAAHPEGEIRGQGQFPAGLEPYGVYLAELTDDALDATITIMLFHSGNQSQYLGEAITWDMYCNGVEGLESVVMLGEAFDEVLAEFIANDPADMENGDGFCGTGAITPEDVGPGEPWMGRIEQWPPDGWTLDTEIRIVAELFPGTIISPEFLALWLAYHASL